MFLMKLDNAGGVAWQKTYGGYLPLMVRSDNMGYKIAAGSGSVGNLLVLHVDAQGAVVSAQQFNSGQPGLTPTALAASATADGGIAFAGVYGLSAWAAKVNSADAIIWQQSVLSESNLGDSGNALFELPSGAIVVAGSRHVDEADANAFLWFIDANGASQKMNAYGSMFPIQKREAFGVSTTTDGRIELTGGAGIFR